MKIFRDITFLAAGPQVNAVVIHLANPTAYTDRMTEITAARHLPPSHAPNQPIVEKSLALDF